MRDPAQARQVELAKLRSAATQLGLDEATRRAGSARLTGGRTDSTAALSARERQALLAEYRAAGWRPTPKAKPRALAQARATQTKEALASKVRALLLDAGRTDAYANAIARRSFQVERWEWLEWEDLKKLVQMLVIDQQRRKHRP